MKKRRENEEKKKKTKGYSRELWRLMDLVVTTPEHPFAFGCSFFEVSNRVVCCGCLLVLCLW